MEKLKDKIIIVTGGNGLLGKEIIKKLLNEGAICINIDINHDTTNDLSCIQCDITKSESIDNAIELVRNKFNCIDGLVNNAYPRTKDWGAKFEDIVFDSI